MVSIGQWALVFVGGGLGAMARHGVNVGFGRLVGTAFPFSTGLVNVTGSFLMGVLAGWFAFKGASAGTQPLRLFLATGVLGGFTTFSAFSLDAVTLWERGDAMQAAAYVVGSVGLTLAGLMAGLWLMRSIS